MSLFELSLIATISGTLAVVFVYSYLYLEYKERYLGIWVISWLIYFVRLIALDQSLFIMQDQAGLKLAYQLMTLSSGMLLVWGTYDFLGQRFGMKWVYVGGLATLLTYFIMQFTDIFFIIALPMSLFFGGIYIWTGVTLMRSIKTRRTAKFIAGYAFVLLGVHILDFPFLRTLAWFIHWGYLIDALLRLVIAISIFLIYFQKTRDELADRERKFRLLAENARDIIFRWRMLPRSECEYISPAVTAITGYDPEFCYRRPRIGLKVVHPDDRPMFRAYLKILEPGCGPLSVRFVGKDKRQIWTEMQAVPILDTDGRIAAIEGIIRDISARKHMEQEMSRLDRLNIIGKMAGNLAHEIRNPLTTVRGFLQMLGNKREFANYKEHFILLLEELDRANSIITDYLSLNKNQVIDFKIQSLNRIINALYPLLQADANKSSILIQLRLGDIPDLSLDEKQIRQIMLNLVRNGIEAMEFGGNLTIKTYWEDGEVVLAVEDQGKGIPGDVLEKLGTPFLTTKEQGTGLGLAVCYSIAANHNARITVSTSPGGTTFFIRFKT